MIRISQGALVCRLAENFIGKTPETGCQIAFGVLGFVIWEILQWSLILAFCYAGSLTIVCLARFGTLDVPINEDVIYLIPYQVAFLAAVFAFFKTAVWLCSQIEVVKED